MTPLLTKPKPGATINPLHPLARGLVGCWLFNEGSGSKVYDISGKNNHGTCIDNPVWGGSKHGGGLYFNGLSNFVIIEDNEELRLYNLSMVGWFYFSPRSTRRMFIGRQYGTGSGNSVALYIRESTDEYRLYGTFNGFAVHRDTDYVLPENEWVQLGFTYDHSYLRFFVNGIEIDSLAETRDITYTNGNIWLIGADRNAVSYGYHTPGTFDGIRFYDRAIKAPEMYQLFSDPFADIITPSVLRLYAPADEPAAEPKPTIPTATKPKPGATINILDHINTGLVGYWLMNEGSGSNIYDISGKGNHGTLTNMSTNDQSSGWSGSKFGGGLGFDGTDDYINCGDDSSLSMTNVITISAWVKTNTLTAYQDISHKGVHTAQHEGMYFGLDNNGKYGLYLGNGTSSTHGLSSDNITTEWNHIAATWDGTTIRLYKNGIQDPSTYLFSGPIYYGSGVFTIGRAAWGGYYFDGILDEIQIYNRRLDTNELKQQYHNPFGGIITPSVLRLYTPAAPVGWAGTINGVTNPAKIYGIPVANIVKVSGVA